MHGLGSDNNEAQATDLGFLRCIRAGEAEDDARPSPGFHANGLIKNGFSDQGPPDRQSRCKGSSVAPGNETLPKGSNTSI